MAATIASLWSGGVRMSCSPLKTSTSVPRKAASDPTRSYPSNAGVKDDITVRSVPSSIFAVSRTMLRGTGEAKEYRSTRNSDRSRLARRIECSSCGRSANSPAVRGPRRSRRIRPIDAATSPFASGIPPGEVEMNAAATTRSRTRSADAWAERQDRHTAHGVAPEEQRPLGHHLGDDVREVVTDLVDGVARDVTAPRPPVPALVPHDDAVPRLGQGPPLEDPALAREAVPVAEHDGRSGQSLDLGLRPGHGLVDLDVQRHAVARDDHELLARHGDEAVPGLERLGPSAVDPVGDDPDGGGRHRQPEPDAEPDEPAVRGAHPSSPTTTRGTRGPIRVTIS